MKTLDVIADLVSSDAPLDAAARQKLSRQVHTLKELAAKMRVVPHPWTLDGRTEVSILGEDGVAQGLAQLQRHRGREQRRRASGRVVRVDGIGHAHAGRYGQSVAGDHAGVQ